MTVRLEVDVSNTQRLLIRVLQHLNKGERVMFLTDSGVGAKVEQRLRVKLSRMRNKIKVDGGKLRYFRLSCSIHAHTEKGLRYDCVVMWASKSETHQAMEILEDLVGHGQSI